MALWIYAEDLCGALIGPFNNLAEVNAHLAFCKIRGDAAETKIVGDGEAKRLEDRWGGNIRMTPEEDRNWDQEETMVTKEQAKPFWMI